jgi:hypothetical protein
VEVTRFRFASQTTRKYHANQHPHRNCFRAVREAFMDGDPRIGGESLDESSQRAGSIQDQISRQTISTTPGILRPPVVA